jgi:biotin-dependent carboxylase-like uncharacterized protein
VSGFRVINPGMLSLLQDSGRFGCHRIGLTTGGPLDPQAFAWANRLLGNDPGSCAIEASFGGLELECQIDTRICVTGATNELTINGRNVELWRTWSLRAGDRVSLGYCTQGCRNYLAVGGGFEAQKIFGSSATVVREGIGGLDGNKLGAGSLLPCNPVAITDDLSLPESARPSYSNRLEVRVIPGYQYAGFGREQQRRFFAADYVVSDRSDRMGYRLEGPSIDSGAREMLSEGICLGAIQIPADGQPIVLLNDRQTIGGYPKIGSVLSLDAARVAQLMPGSRVSFTAISHYLAHNELHLDRARFLRTAAVGIK